jgi:hypothetical protein
MCTVDQMALPECLVCDEETPVSARWAFNLKNSVVLLGTAFLASELVQTILHSQWDDDRPGRERDAAARASQPSHTPISSAVERMP